jgi:dimethylaniline monooxygenase (N-oxide forming)
MNGRPTCCVIGAGISGISAARALCAAGFAVVVLEKAGNLGGVWDPDRSYPNISTQTNRGQYSFSDHPMPRHWAEWPSGAEVHGYLEDYAKHSGVRDLIRFGRAVSTVRHDPVGQEWVVAHSGEDGEDTSRFSHVVVATGIFNRPHVPDVPGMEVFHAAGGRILHTSQATEADLLTGKRVVVVGFQKSATDVASYAADRAASTTLVYRRAMWKVPRHFLGVINVKFLFYSRFVEAMSEPWEPTPGERFLHSAGKPVVWTFWRAIELAMRRQFRLREAGLVPDHPFESQIGCNLSVAPKAYYEAVRTGRIVARCGTVAGYEADALLLGDGTRIPADVVVYGTGYTPSLPFLDDATRAGLLGPDGYFRLYRNILPPEHPTLGFVGYNSSLFCQLSAELAARWLAELWSGRFTVPAAEVMRTQVESRLQWYREHRPMDLESYRNACVAPFNYRHFDELLRDMGAPTRRSRNRLLEGVRPLTLPHYAEHLARVGTHVEPQGQGAAACFGGGGGISAALSRSGARHLRK